jgi:hypothetical protein
MRVVVHLENVTPPKRLLFSPCPSGVEHNVMDSVDTLGRSYLSEQIKREAARKRSGKNVDQVFALLTKHGLHHNRTQWNSRSINSFEQKLRRTRVSPIGFGLWVSTSQLAASLPLRGVMLESWESWESYEE